MGRKNRLPTTYDLFVIGEQLRIQMTKSNLIKDQRYLFRKHRQCFVAKDAVDWLVKMHHVDTRSEATAAMTVLQEFNVIHHVSEEQEFKDRNALFRFARDNDSYKADRELQPFYRGLEIYNKLAKYGKDVVKKIYHKGELCSDVFYGCDLVDFLLEWETQIDRDLVTEEMKDLLARDIIRHLTDDCHFMDDKIAYQFNVDFDKNCLLIDVLEIMESFNTLAVNRLMEMALADKSPITTGTTYDESDEEENKEIEPATPIFSNLPQIQLFDEHIKQILADKMGFGLVLRGSGPSLVSRVDPLGPAAKAHIKVGQVITSVNGNPVSSLNHKSVGLILAQHESTFIPLRLGVSDLGKTRRSNSRRLSLQT